MKDRFWSWSILSAGRLSGLHWWMIKEQINLRHRWNGSILSGANGKNGIIRDHGMKNGGVVLINQGYSVVMEVRIDPYCCWPWSKYSPTMYFPKMSLPDYRTEYGKENHINGLEEPRGYMKHKPDSECGYFQGRFPWEYVYRYNPEDRGRIGIWRIIQLFEKTGFNW